MRINRIFSAWIIKEDDGTFSVDTPISYEKGFNSEDGATKYASTYGSSDERAL